MNGYELSEHHRTPTYYRTIEPTAQDVIDALAVLPPGTTVETMAGDGGVDNPTGVWYHPETQTVSIG